MARQDFARQADHARVDGLGRAATSGASDGVAQPARCAQLLHQAAAFGIDIVAMLVAHGLLRPAVERNRKFAVPRFEERPAQVFERVHQSPLKTGLPLATKAL